MESMIQRVSVPITFPNGVRIGDAKSFGNILVQARDGAERFVLRGSALAGTVRHALTTQCQQQDYGIEEIEYWFGSGQENNSSLTASKLKFADTLFSVGNSSLKGLRIRSHNVIDRHRGAPIKGALVSIESLPPFTEANLVLSLQSIASDFDRAKELLERIVGLFEEGLLLGGSVARGIGLAQIHGKVMWNYWDLTQIDQHAAWLDECFLSSRGKTASTVNPSKTAPFVPRVSGASKQVVVFSLKVPRGQDFLVGAGHGNEYALEPQEVPDAQGKSGWLLPGSSLRGLFRSYIARLASREGELVADSTERHIQRNQDPRNPVHLQASDIGFGFVPKDEHASMYESPGSTECPVTSLFGSSFAKGRIHIADSVDFTRQPSDAQVRKHVAIDRFSGSANDGALFDNLVITRAEFIVRLEIRNPTEQECRWVCQAIRALDLGIIRVGSNKGAGRLALKQTPTAQGPFSHLFQSLEPMEF